MAGAGTRQMLALLGGWMRPGRLGDAVHTSLPSTGGGPWIEFNQTIQTANCARCPGRFSVVCSSSAARAAEGGDSHSPAWRWGRDSQHAAKDNPRAQKHAGMCSVAAGLAGRRKLRPRRAEPSALPGVSEKRRGRSRTATRGRRTLALSAMRNAGTLPRTTYPPSRHSLRY
jgi:hypothetical protein